MWSSNITRRFVLLGAASALTACGFAPAHGPGSATNRLLGQVSVDEIKTSDGFHLTRQLEHRIGRSTAPRFGLSVALSTEQKGVAVTSDNQTTRIEMFGTATYALRQLSDNEVVLSGKANSFTGYSTTGATVSELASARDARERLMVILADQIATQLIARAGELPE
jgi:LPS-assembly lipoprotein